MKRITIRELHARTGRLIRLAAEHGEILVTDHGKAVAKILPHVEEKTTPYFSRRKQTPAFRKLAASDKLQTSRDTTQLISEDREDRVL
jgi:antitoxin (DNA-binding transcriptional repressor) of toxin-antitoxin stability system